MAELATVRTEIKTWERTFKESNGRVPTVDDIRQNNHMGRSRHVPILQMLDCSAAEKYKLYKRLSKAAVPSDSSNKEKLVPRPSTPPRTARPKEPTSVLILKSRVVQSTAPLAAFNPFSPQKKGKERDGNGSRTFDEPRANLFGKSQSTPRTYRSSSPDPFPLIIPVRGSSSTSSSSEFAQSLGPVPTSAVSRARKRLRGEPVSPSPNKEKRRRTTSQTIIPFTRLVLDPPDSEDDFEAQDADISFVDNSPVKAPASGRLFPQLFEEALPSADLFGVKPNLVSMDVDEEEPMKPCRKVTQTTRVPTRKSTKTTSASADVDAGPTKHRDVTKLSAISRTNSSRATSESSSRSSTKRPVSDDEVDDRQPRSKSPFIPPSPPPSGTVSSFNRHGKHLAKAKTATQSSRKKAKVDERTTDDSDGLEEKTKLKIVARNSTRVRRTAAGSEEDDVEFDSDPVLGYARFAGPRVSSPNTPQQTEDNRVEINLPDELQRVLAIQSAAPKLQLSEEDRLVKGLLYGRRTTHYDPNKGGEIWDVGEDHNIGSDEDANRFTEGEDDWEGEPVPWEVGEL